MLQNISIPNTCWSFEPSIHPRRKKITFFREKKISTTNLFIYFYV